MYFITEQAVYKRYLKQLNKGWPIQIHKRLTEEKKMKKASRNQQQNNN
jgi:hypothetical protein